jgi:hypothetical protein
MARHHSRISGCSSRQSRRSSRDQSRIAWGQRIYLIVMAWSSASECLFRPRCRKHCASTAIRTRAGWRRTQETPDAGNAVSVSALANKSAGRRAPNPKTFFPPSARTTQSPGVSRAIIRPIISRRTCGSPRWQAGHPYPSSPTRRAGFCAPCSTSAEWGAFR